MATIKINDLPAGDAALNDNLPRENAAGIDARITIQQLVDLAPQGDVVGPASSTDNAFPLFNGTTGKLIKNQSLLTVSGNALNGNYSSGYNFSGGSFQFGAAGVVADGSLSNSQINWSVVGNNIQGKYKNSSGTVFSFTLPNIGTSSYVKISNQSVIGPTSFVDFTNLTTAYKKYILEITGFTAVSLSQILTMRVSTDNGSTFVSSAGAYFYTNQFISNVDGSVLDSYSGVGGTTAIILSNPLNTSETGNSFTVEITNAMDASLSTKVVSRGYQFTATNAEGGIFGGGRRNANEANNAIRLLMDSGQIATGEFTLYGVLA